MRFSAIAILGLALVATPVWAQQNNNSASGRPVFATNICPQQVPCTEDGMTSQQWAQFADACISSSFGAQNPNGFTNDTVGWDASNCLTAKPNAFKRGNGGSMSPSCCILPLPSGNACVMRCSVVGE